MDIQRDELEALRTDRGQVMDNIYRNCCPKFVHWARRRCGLAEHDLTDLFHDAVLIMLKNRESGRLTQLVATLCTYLFGVGKLLLKAKMRSKDRLQPTENMDAVRPEEHDLGAEQRLIQAEESQRLTDLVAGLGEQCRSILSLTYEKEMSSEEIAEAMGYSSADVVRQLRKRCLDKLRNRYF